MGHPSFSQDVYKSIMENFATGHRYFLAFAQTQRPIVSLLGTITIL
jgi:hypothetical protein